MSNAERRLARWALSAGLPEEAFGLGARVTMMGRAGVRIEGQSGMIELGEEHIRLRTPDGVLCVVGRALKLRALSPDEAIIEGAPVETVTYGQAKK